MSKIAVFSLIMAVCLAGCRCGCQQVAAPADLISDSATKAAAFSAADKALSGMNFEHAIMDVNSGIIETGRGGQQIERQIDAGSLSGDVILQIGI